MDRKIIFFDIDGTILCPEFGRVTDNVRQCIAQAQKRGHLCFIASGRPYSFIAENIKEIQFDGYILANGAHLKYKGEDSAVQYLNLEDIRELCARFRQKNIQYILATPTFSYIDPSFTELLNFYGKCNIDFENFVYDFDEEEVFRRTLKIEAWAGSQEDIDYTRQHCGKFATELREPGHSMEIYGKQVSKAAGINKVLEMFQLPRENSFCFGDGPNDVEMFQTVGHGFAMGNAVDEIKALGEEICLSVEKDGAAVKMRELFESNVL